MRARLVRAGLIALGCVFAACSKHNDTSKTNTPPPSSATQQRIDPCANGDFAAVMKEHPAPLLCAAGKLMPDGEAICDSTFGFDWATFDPPDLAEASTAEKMQTGLDSLCAQLRTMPAAEAKDTAGKLNAWVDTYLEIAPIQNSAPEAFGTATAYVKELSDLLPGDISMRAPSKAETGNSLATAEFTELMYSMTTRLSGLPPAERDRLLGELKHEATRAANRQ
ncbi:MAG TPA: hypothetical protein VFH33_02825 [Candidatus Krumholzibacteria bacterium]|nr:hypothetical protein [Candidatus Krumholzibacteria bacterium]